MPNSPAMAAGLQAGDIITRYNGKEIGMSTELPHLVGRTKVGEKAKLQVVRDGKERAFTVTIGALPDEEARPKAKPAEEPVKADNQLNIKVRDLKIGRASCRERVWIAVVDELCEKQMK